MANRKKATDLLLEQLSHIDKYTNVDNRARYERMFKAMSDSQFDTFMKRVRDGQECFYIYIPNMEEHPLIDDVLKLGDKLGVELFQHLEMTDDLTGIKFTTPEKYMCARLPIRTQTQYGDHKGSFPKGDSRIDSMTGQVTGDDRSAAITKPESQSLLTKGLTTTLKEFASMRGGNIEATQGGIRKSAEETGVVQLREIDDNTLNRTAKTAAVILETMHVENNITEKE